MGHDHLRWDVHEKVACVAADQQRMMEQAECKSCEKNGHTDVLSTATDFKSNAVFCFGIFRSRDFLFRDYQKCPLNLWPAWKLTDQTIWYHYRSLKLGQTADITLCNC